VAALKSGVLRYSGYGTVACCNSPVPASQSHTVLSDEADASRRPLGENTTPWNHYMKAYSLELGGSVAAVCKIPTTAELFTHHSRRWAAHRD